MLPSFPNVTNYTGLAEKLYPYLLNAIEQGGAVASLTFGKILLIRAGGAGVTSYAVTAAGLTAALAAASAGDAVWIPPCTLVGNWTVPASVGVQAYGKKANLQSTLTGTVTLGAGAFLNSVYVNPSVSSGSAFAGVIGPASGTAYLNDCSIIVTNSGAGNAYGIQGGAGILWIWNCYIYGNATGGGSGYGIYEGAGEIDVEGGWVRGSTLPAIKEGESPSTILVSNLTWKALSLWNGSSNDSPPASWTTAGFNDGGWSTPVTADYGAAGGPPSGSTPIWTTATPVSYTEQVLFRKIVNIPEGFSSATLFIADDDNSKVYINEVLIHNGTFGITDFIIPTIEIDISANLVVGDNIIAVHGENYFVGAGQAWIGLKITAVILQDSLLLTNAVRMDPVVGVPTLGDKGVWDVANYPTRHASDFVSGDSHHPAITISADVDAFMSLVGQLLGMDSIAANRFLGSPTGAPGVMTPRVLANADLPNPLALLASSILILASDAVTVSKSYHIIAAETGTTDNLATINGSTERQFLMIQADAGDTITVKHGTGNIYLNSAADFSLTGDKTLLLFYDGTNWSDVGAGGGGGALADHDHSGDAGDGGTFDAANLTSGAAADGYALTADGVGGAAWEAVAGGTDEKAKVSANDTTAGYLNGKLVAGSNITLTENNDGGNETLTIASTATISGLAPAVKPLLNLNYK